MESEPTPVNPEDFILDAGSNLVQVRCPNCGSTDDLWLMECAPGYSWSYVNGCGCWGFIHKQV